MCFNHFEFVNSFLLFDDKGGDVYFGVCFCDI